MDEKDRERLREPVRELGEFEDRGERRIREIAREVAREEVERGRVSGEVLEVTPTPTAGEWDEAVAVASDNERLRAAITAAIEIFPRTPAYEPTFQLMRRALTRPPRGPVVLICGGGDWADASVTPLIPRNENYERELAAYPGYAACGKHLDGWLKGRGWREPISTEAVMHWDT